MYVLVRFVEVLVDFELAIGHSNFRWERILLVSRDEAWIGWWRKRDVID